MKDLRNLLPEPARLVLAPKNAQWEIGGGRWKVAKGYTHSAPRVGLILPYPFQQTPGGGRQGRSRVV